MPAEIVLIEDIQPFLTTDQIETTLPCFECGNCCRYIKGKFQLSEVVRFIDRGFPTIICKNKYQFTSIRDDSKSYPEMLYIFSESFKDALPLLIDIFPTIDPSEREDFQHMEVEFLIIGDCINLDSETNRCVDYANRPNLCQNFELGGGGCTNIRKSYDLHATSLTQSLPAHIIV